MVIIKSSEMLQAYNRFSEMILNTVRRGNALKEKEESFNIVNISKM